MYKSDFESISVPKIPFFTVKHSRNVLAAQCYSNIFYGLWEEQVVVVKLLKSQTPEIKNFLRETKMMAYLRRIDPQSTFTVQLHAMVPHSTPYIIMEYLPLGTLWDILQSGLHLPWDWRLRIALDIANAIHFLHSQRILHLNIKSSNILLYFKDGRISAKLTDFGRARFIGEEHMPLGKNVWVDPYRIYEKPSEATDVFSFGIVFWEIVTRTNIRESYSDPSWVLHIWLFEGFRVKANGSYPPEINEIIFQCQKQTGNAYHPPGNPEKIG